MKRAWLVMASALMAPVPGWGAPIVDGSLDPEYGPALSTQTTQTSFGDVLPGFHPSDSLTRAFGSELDAAYGEVAGGVLHLLFTGNLHVYLTEPLTLPHVLHVLVDCVPGGQNQLRSDNPDVGLFTDALRDVSGLTFDADFSPDYWFASDLAGSMQPLYTYFAELGSNGNGTGYYLGRTGGGGPGTLSEGTNPFGVRCTINQLNRAGVTEGCVAASGAGVTTGVEWAIPYSAIGSPVGAIKVCALVSRVTGQVSNQVLGPVPPGTCTLGVATGVDFEAIPGAQYFTIEDVVPVNGVSWGRVKVLYR